MNAPAASIESLPGSELIGAGVRDLKAGRITPAACLVAIAEPRLRRAGLMVSVDPRVILDPEHRLYQLLRVEGGDSYSRYNALIRRLISFEQALEHRATRSKAMAHLSE